MIQINDYSNIQLDGYGTYSYYDDDTNTYVTIPPEQVTPEMQRAVMNQQYGYQYQQQPYLVGQPILCVCLLLHIVVPQHKTKV